MKCGCCIVSYGFRDEIAEWGIGRAAACAFALGIGSAFVGRKLILLTHGPQSSLQRTVLVPDAEVERFVRVGVPLGFVADHARVEDARLNPQEGHVRWRQAPLGQKLDGLRIITKSLFQHFPKVFENCEPESAQTCAGTAQPWAWTWESCWSERRPRASDRASESSYAQQNWPTDSAS